MHYRMLLWPHANARYQNEALKLASAELELMLGRIAPGAEIYADGEIGMPCLDLQTPSAVDAAALSRHSLLYGLFEVRDGLLSPVTGRMPAAVGQDLPAILKYKGKTNELFLQLLINVALYASAFWGEADAPLSMLDPMCGRATALFVAANYGWDAVGADVDRSDLKEAEQYFKRYLEYHRFKHTVTRASRTLKQGSAPECRFEYAPDAHAPRRSLSLLGLDAACAAEALGREAFHIIACDLPYGVRHDARLSPGAPKRGNWLEALLASALPGWKRVLKPGGAIALSFNAQNLKLERVRELMVQAGLEVLQGGAYDGFSHWVEQAITRDIAVCRKPISSHRR